MKAMTKKKTDEIKEWEKYPRLDHLSGDMRLRLEERQRQKKVRYVLFRLQTQAEQNKDLNDIEALEGFLEYWLEQEPVYAIDPRGKRKEVPPNKRKKVKDLGGYEKFAKVWDVDADLKVYIRHSSVWQEWNAQLIKVAPVLGE